MVSKFLKRSLIVKFHYNMSFRLPVCSLTGKVILNIKLIYGYSKLVLYLVLTLPNEDCRLTLESSCYDEILRSENVSETVL